MYNNGRAENASRSLALFFIPKLEEAKGISLNAHTTLTKENGFWLRPHLKIIVLF